MRLGIYGDWVRDRVWVSVLGGLLVEQIPTEESGEQTVYVELVWYRGQLSSVHGAGGSVLQERREQQRWTDPYLSWH